MIYFLTIAIICIRTLSLYRSLPFSLIDRIVCSCDKKFITVAKVHKNGVIFRNQDRVVGKAGRFNDGAANSRRRNVSGWDAMSRYGGKCKTRPRLRGNGILSSSATGPLISAVVTFPKCFVPLLLWTIFTHASSLPWLPLSVQTIRRD